MSEQPSIEELISKDIAFMGSDWVDDETVTEGPMKGLRYNGKKPCINCNDVFFWGCADDEDINDETLPLYHKALDDCSQNHGTAAMLYCARIRKERPQGAIYSCIPKEFWSLFDACGPEKETGFGNPYKPGEYDDEYLSKG